MDCHILYSVGAGDRQHQPEGNGSNLVQPEYNISLEWSTVASIVRDCFKIDFELAYLENNWIGNL